MRISEGGTSGRRNKRDNRSASDEIEDRFWLADAILSPCDHGVMISGQLGRYDRRKKGCRSDRQ